jgi:hypothetical protein
MTKLASYMNYHLIPFPAKLLSIRRLIIISSCIVNLVQSSILQAQTFNGYTLYSKMGNNSVYLLDMNHNIYHTWSSSVQTGYSTYLLPNHHIMRTVQNNGNQLSGPAMCGKVQDLDWNGNVTWQFTYSTSTYCSHHDIHPMPNGNVLLIVYEVKTAAEAVQAGCSQSMTIWPDKIVEVQPSGTSGGTIVWEWHAWDHLVQDHDPTKSNYGVVANHPELLNINYNTQKEWMHTNGIDYNATLDQIVISSHYLNEIYVIDHSTTTAEAAGHTGGNSGKGGDILYRWGNPAAYAAGTASNQVFKVVHDAHWVPEGCPMANNLVGFNNKGINNNQSCIDIIAPPYNGYTYSLTPGTAYLPSTYTWRHACLGNAQDQSNSQQLPNGNMLICIASTGYIYEIDANQNLLWSQTVGGTVAKAYRYSECYVNGSATATVSASPTQVCSGGSSQLNVTATGGSSYTYQWTSNPPGYTSTLQNPIVIPASTTTYIVTVTSGTCTVSDSVTIEVIPQPTATVSASPQEVCLGGSSQLSALLTGGLSYVFVWTSVPSGFTSNLQNPSVSPSETTTYYLTASSGTCSASGSTMVTVNPQPTTDATANPAEICTGGSSQLDVIVSGAPSYSYSWISIPAGFISNLQNPIVSPTATTEYIVTVASGNCSAIDSQVITVTPQPTATATASPEVICIGGSSQLFASVGNASGYTYSWTSSPGGFTSNLQNPVVIPMETTTYYVTAINGNCTATASVTVTVNQQPTASASATPVIICMGESSQLDVAVSGGLNYTYSWTSIPNGFTSGLQNPIVSPSVTTMYHVTAINGSCNAADEASVTVYSLPETPIITRSNDTLFSNAPSGNQWYYNQLILPGDTLPWIVLQQNGEFTVQVTDGNECVSAMSAPYMYVRINEILSDGSIRICPNPTAGILMLKGEILDKCQFEVLVTDITGRQLMRVHNTIKLDLTLLNSGIYYIAVITQNELFSQKVIINN